MNPTKAPTKALVAEIPGLTCDPLQSAEALAEAPPAGNDSPLGGESVFAMIRKWAAKGGLAIIDYGLISGSNFLLGILLARWLTPREYGAYALSFSFFILAGFLYQSLLLEPLSVFSGTLFRDNIRGYLKTALGIHWALSLAMCLVLAVAAVVTSVVGHSAVLAIALSGMTIATPFILALLIAGGPVEKWCHKRLGPEDDPRASLDSDREI